MEKSPEAFRTISEVAADLDVPQHVLRFWESKFSQVKPMNRGGGRRYYRPNDVELLRGIRHLLYGEGYTIRGVQKILREHGVSFVIDSGLSAKPVSKPHKGEVDAEDGAVMVDQATLAAAGEASGLNEEQIRALQAALFELSEIKRLLDSS